MVWPWPRRFHPWPWTKRWPSRPSSWPRPHPNGLGAAGTNWPILVSGYFPKRAPTWGAAQPVVLGLVQFSPKASSEAHDTWCNSCRGHTTLVSLAMIRSAGAAVPCLLRAARRDWLHAPRAKCCVGFQIPYGGARLGLYLVVLHPHLRCGGPSWIPQWLHPGSCHAAIVGSSVRHADPWSSAQYK